MKFGENLKRLRTQAGMTQADLARSLGVSVRSVAFYEADERHPDFDGLLVLADLFDVSLDFLVGRCEDPSAHKSDASS